MEWETRTSHTEEPHDSAWTDLIWETLCAVDTWRLDYSRRLLCTKCSCILVVSCTYSWVDRPSICLDLTDNRSARSYWRPSCLCLFYSQSVAGIVAQWSWKYRSRSSRECSPECRRTLRPNSRHRCKCSWPIWCLTNTKYSFSSS